MNLRKYQRGFSAVELVVVVVVVGVLALAGYLVYSRQNNEPAVDSSQSAVADDVPAAPEINSTGDLDKAGETLDQVNIEGSSSSDGSQLDKEVDSF